VQHLALLEAGIEFNYWYLYPIYVKRHTDPDLVVKPEYTLTDNVEMSNKNEPS